MTPDNPHPLRGPDPPPWAKVVGGGCGPRVPLLGRSAVTEPLYVYRWGKYRPELKGQLCRVLARGAMNTALVQFATGEQVVVSRNALARLKP